MNKRLYRVTDYAYLLLSYVSSQSVRYYRFSQEALLLFQSITRKLPFH
ncbi:hypothetical protein [Bacteroides acidifaciens]|nr:hypothetical protein [Bacteroides acidifaciens]MDE6821916.1 hypothetical protein [Bacteroides acidifaciens]